MLCRLFGFRSLSGAFNQLKISATLSAALYLPRSATAARSGELPSAKGVWIIFSDEFVEH
jgi:hypothetical protein